MPIHRNEPPREPPPDVWERSKERGQSILSNVERTHGALEHVSSLGLLMAAVAAMKATSASEQDVVNIARRIYRDSHLRLIS